MYRGDSKGESEQAVCAVPNKWATRHGFAAQRGREVVVDGGFHRQFLLTV